MYENCTGYSEEGNMTNNKCICYNPTFGSNVLCNENNATVKMWKQSNNKCIEKEHCDGDPGV